MGISCGMYLPSRLQSQRVPATAKASEIPNEQAKSHCFHISLLSWSRRQRASRAAIMQSEGCSALIKIVGVRSAPPVRKKKANVKFEGVLDKQIDLLFAVRGFFFQCSPTSVH